MNLPPLEPTEGKRQEVAAMFDRVAPRYDFLNRVLSAGTDIRWRNKAVRLLGEHIPGGPAGKTILDMATGTADLAISASRLRPKEIVGVDPSEGMLDVGRKKIAEKKLDTMIRLEVGASEDLPFESDTFDGAMVAFGVRNFEDRIGGLREISRVLKPGCPLLVLEFSQPRGPIAPLFGFYFHRILPKIGGLISGDSGAYTYLHDSVQIFPDGQDFLDEMTEAGFDKTSAKRLTFGIASIYIGHAV